MRRASSWEGPARPELGDGGGRGPGLAGSRQRQWGTRRIWRGRGRRLRRSPRLVRGVRGAVS